MPKYLIIGFLMFSIGCKQSAEHAIQEPWDYLTIVSEHNTQINILNGSDTSEVLFYHNGSFFFSAA